MRLIRLLTFLVFVFAAAVGGRIVQRAKATEVPQLGLQPALPNRPVSFHDRLIVGLEARLKNEIAFVDAVVLEVQAGHLPERLVDQTFFWARQRSAVIRNGRTNRPIIYFMPAMRARANLLHITL